MHTEPSVPSQTRRWFQLHLSTAFMTMLAIGAVMTFFFRATHVQVESEGFRMGQMGWPWTAVCKVERVTKWGETTAQVFDEFVPVKVGEYFVSYKPLAADIVVILFVLALIGCMFEIPIRWDEEEKEKRRLGRGSQRLAAQALETPVLRRWYHLSKASIGVWIVTTFLLVAVNLAARVQYGWPWVFWQDLDIDSSAYHEFVWSLAAADMGVAVGLVVFFVGVVEWGIRVTRNPPRGRGKRANAVAVSKSKII